MIAWGNEKFDLLAEKRKLKEAKEKEKELNLNLLLMQQEHNLEKAFMMKKELESINKNKEVLIEKKKAMYLSLFDSAISKEMPWMKR